MWWKSFELYCKDKFVEKKLFFLAVKHFYCLFTVYVKVFFAIWIKIDKNVTPCLFRLSCLIHFTVFSNVTAY